MNTPTTIPTGFPYGRPIYPPQFGCPGLTGPLPHVSQASGATPQHDIKPFLDWAQCPMPPSKVPTLSSDRALQGVPNYTNWTVRMRAQLGQIPHDVIFGRSLPPPARDAIACGVYAAWDGFTLSSIIGSVGGHLVPYLSGHSAASAWSFLGSRFAPTDAQATLRVLRNFWPLRLTAADPAALDAFELEYYGIVSCIDQLKIDVSTLCSAHLLSALAGLAQHLHLSSLP